LALTLS